MKKKIEPTLTQIGVSFVIVFLIGLALWPAIDAFFFEIAMPWANTHKWLVPIVSVSYVLTICFSIPVAVLTMRFMAMKMAENTNEGKENDDI